MQRLPDGTVVVTVKDPRERRAERLTLALLIVWLGVTLSIDEPEGLTPLGFGAILLGSAFYQRLRGWHGGLVSWVVGAILVGIGIGDLSSSADIPWFGIAVILVGLWLVARTARRAF
jgi:glucose-6-phosphate-specific signal transduction histidine kinase